MKKLVQKRRVLPPAIHTYHGRVHIPNITTKPEVFPNKKIFINICCGGHIVVDESDMMEKKT